MARICEDDGIDRQEIQREDNDLKSELQPHGSTEATTEELGIEGGRIADQRCEGD